WTSCRKGVGPTETSSGFLTSKNSMQKMARSIPAFAGVVARHFSSWAVAQALTQHVVQDAAVQEIANLVQGVDATKDGEAVAAAVRTPDRHRQLLSRLQVGRQAANVQHLVAGQPQGVTVLAVEELQGQHAHADQVGTVDALETLGDHRPDAQQGGALGGPV